MENIVSLLIFVTIIAAFAYFKSSKVKDFMDTKVFRKKPKESVDAYPELEPLGGFPGVFKAPSEAPKPGKYGIRDPLVATPTPTTYEKPAVEAPVKPEAPISVPLDYPKMDETPTKSFYSQKTIDFPAPEHAVWEQFDPLPGFSGRIKVTITESPASPAGDKPNYSMLILDNHQNPISPALHFQYTGGSLSGATADRYRLGDHFIVKPGVSYQVYVICRTPVNAKAILTINGSAM